MGSTNLTTTPVILRCAYFPTPLHAAISDTLMAGGLLSDWAAERILCRLTPEEMQVDKQ